MNKPRITNAVAGVSAALLIFALLSVGCTPSIGDACEANGDCDTDHVCDLSQDGGYCTITPCPRAGCPGGSVCVHFDELSSWCMQACGVFDYCREGYRCVTDFVDSSTEVVEPFCNQAEPVNTTDAAPVDQIEDTAG
jgi:hypothetical protein